MYKLLWGFAWRRVWWGRRDLNSRACSSRDHVGAWAVPPKPRLRGIAPYPTRLDYGPCAL